jgi:hypothetical protein
MAFAVISVLAQIEDMIAQVLIEELACHTDARGWVVEPMDETGLARHRNVHVVWTEPVRCGEIIIISRARKPCCWSGPRAGALARGRRPARTARQRWPGLAFHLSPRHSTRHAKHRDRPLILTSYSTHPLDRDHPDTVRAELIVP